MSKAVRPRKGVSPAIAGRDRDAFGHPRAQQPGVYLDRHGKPVPVYVAPGMERTQGMDARIYVDPASVPLVDVRTWGDAS